MKLTIREALGFRIRTLVAGACLFAGNLHAANIVIGTGADASYLVLESGNIGVRTYEVRYDSSSGPFDSKFLLDQVLANDSSVTMSFSNFGSVSEPNFFVNWITFNAVRETNSFVEPYIYWAQWVSGGDAGFPSAAPIAAGAWAVGSGVSTPYRIIAPGSWDALVFSGGSTPPSVALVPEISTFTLVPLVGLLLGVRRRRVK